MINNVTMNGGIGDDRIEYDGGIAGGVNASLVGGEGKDTIQSFGGRYITIDGGEGDDSLYSNANYATILGVGGDDTLRAGYYGYFQLLDGGTGDDVLSLDGGARYATIKYAAGDGNDVIWGYNSDTTIHITSGAITSKTISGNDVVLTVSDGIEDNAGTMTLKNAATLGAVTVMDSLGAVTTLGAGVNITVSSPFSTTNASDYDDYIVIKNPGASAATVNALGGNDTIMAGGLTNPGSWSAVINAGTGNDVAYVGTYGSTVDGGAGSDSISLSGLYNSDKDYQNVAYSYGGNNRAIGGAGDDTIDNQGSTNSTIEGGDGDDLINNNAPRASILGGAGADSITNNKPYSTIYGGADNDYIVNTNITGYNVSGTKAIIYGDAGDDYIKNTADSVSVYGGAGDDTIINTRKGTYTPVGEKSYLDGGDGTDYISNTENNVTIVGGKGNDTIINSGANTTYVYGTGDGSDVIEDWNETSKISLTSGAVSGYSLSGSNVILKIGSDTLTLKKAKDKAISIVASDGTAISTVISAESMDSDSTVIAGLSYNADKTVLTVSDVYSAKTLPANAYVSSVDTIKANGRNKAIHIVGNVNDNSIIGGAAADTLDGGAGDDTLRGGAGADYLIGGAGADVFQYANGDGKDIIADISTDDTFKITKGTISKITTSKKNADVVLTIGSGKVTFKDALTKSIAIEDMNDNKVSVTGGIYTIYNDASEANIVGLGGGDSINNKGSHSTIDGGAGADTLFSSGDRSVIEGGAGNDSIYVDNQAPFSVKDVGSTVYAGAGNDTVQVTGIGHVIYGDAGNDYIESRQNPQAVGGRNLIHGGAGNDTIVMYYNDTVSYANGDGNDVLTYLNNANFGAVIKLEKNSKGVDTQITQVTTGGKTNPKDLVLKVGGGSITVKDGVGEAITIIDTNGNTSTQAYGTATISVTDSMSDTIDVSKDSAVLEVDASSRTRDVALIGNTKDNTIIGGAGSDMLTGGKGKDVFVYSGGNDTITDYTAGQDIIKFSSDTYLMDASLSGEDTGDDIIFYTNKGNITIWNAVKNDKNGNYIGNKITVIDADGVNTGAQLYDMATIAASNADGNTIKANLEVKTVDAGKHSKAAYLLGNNNDNTLISGGGADTIDGVYGNNVLTGGKGKDLFIFDAMSGSDTITDYTAKQDSITIAAGLYADYTVDGKNVIMTFTDASANTIANTLTILNGKDKVITVNGKDDTYNDKTELVLTKNDSGKFDMNEDKYSLIKTVDGSKTTKGVELIANDNGNTLTGGFGKDTFVYTTGGGNDTITSYNAYDDVIQLGKKTSISKAQVVETKDAEGYVIQSNYVFTIGKGKLTVQDGADKTITFVDEDGNKIKYESQVAASNAVAYQERWFLDEAFARDSEVDSILDNKANLITVDYKFNNDDFSNLINSIPLVSNKKQDKK